MRIGVFASFMAGEKGHEKNVSAHVQVPVETIRRLREAGHDAHVMTNEFGEQHALPHAVPSDAPVHLVPDGRKRPKQMRGGGKSTGYRPLGLVRQLRAMRGIAKREKLDALHVFGLSRTAMLGGLLRRSGMKTPVVATMIAGNLPRGTGRFGRWTLGGVDHFVASTEFAANQFNGFGPPCTLVRHGIIRDLRVELETLLGSADPPPAPGPRRRVLFWRDPNEMNGADCCRDAFAALAPRYPDLSFDFAIRPTRVEVPGIDALAAHHDNINVFRFPYADGITLPGLIAESILVVLPFRKLTVDPQLSVAESLAAGVPVVGTSIRSMPELIEDGVTGRIVAPGESAPLTQAIDDLLGDRTKLDAMHARTAEHFARRWSWDGYVDELEKVYRSVAR